MIHLAIVAFMLSAIVGLWSTFDKQHGFSRFLLIGMSAAAYMLILYNGERARRYAILALAILALLACLGLAISSLIIPELAGLGVGPPGPVPAASAWLDAVPPAGLLVVLMPFQVAGWCSASRHQDRSSARFWLAAIVLSVATIVASGSLASVLTLVLGTLSVALWKLSSGLARRLAWPCGRSLAVVGLLAGAAAVPLLIVGKGIVTAAMGSGALANRVEIAQQSARLASDFALMGGGLGSIPGLYAHYIRGLPVFHVPHSHNLYLNILIELGVPGLVAFLSMYAAAGWLLLRSLLRVRPSGGTSWFLPAACLAAVAIILVQGMYDDPFYASWALPLLLVLPGLAVSLARTVRIGHAFIPARTLLLVAAMPVLLVGLNWQAAGSTWQAYRGAVEMARLELRGWPSGKWSDGRLAPLLEGAELRFRQALTFQPGNRTALHRLGLIAMERRDYPAAANFLIEANHHDPGHQGIRKALGYCLVWSGQYERAGQFLSGVPEAERELGIYQGWWSSHGRPDLSRHSANMLALLKSN